MGMAFARVFTYSVYSSHLGLLWLRLALLFVCALGSPVRMVLMVGHASPVTVTSVSRMQCVEGGRERQEGRCR